MRMFIVVALAVAIGLGTAVSPFASSSPDGLEKVAEQQGFLEQGRVADAPLPGYGDDRLATAAAGFAGTLLVFAAGWGVVRLVRRPVAA